MNSASQMASRTMPHLIDDPKTGKQKFRNTVISFLKEKRCFWHSGEVANSSALVDIIWSIDGHHDTLNSRSCPIPALFHCFSGYNVPEKST